MIIFTNNIHYIVLNLLYYNTIIINTHYNKLHLQITNIIHIHYDIIFTLHYITLHYSLHYFEKLY